MAVTRNSRWNRSVIVSYRDALGRTLRRNYIAPLPRLEIGSQSDIRFYRITQRDDWASIAYRAYRDPNTWWAIAENQQVVDPFDEMQVATQLRIPSRFTLQFEILNFSPIAQIGIDGAVAA